MKSSENILNNGNLISVLRNGGVAVMPTDTIYGIVGRAENPVTVERIYLARQRMPEKPCIILISRENEIEKFGIVLSGEQKNKIKEYWPGPVSVVLDCKDESFTYLHRGTETLAFRLPGEGWLRSLLTQTGPLIAPSANTEGSLPAGSTEEAKKYFGDKVDLYVDVGTIVGKSSKIIRLYKNGASSIIRE